ncbi:hypothetical protein AB6A40_002089 [Gnathostoma spinigerum]|uniref:C2 domain-containing protein n=1 Tax=Gnathostoma spinigerum TaxID=75299 RepID=A0ABD6E5Q3_9BILA
MATASDEVKQTRPSVLTSHNINERKRVRQEEIPSHVHALMNLSSDFDDDEEEIECSRGCSNDSQSDFTFDGGHRRPMPVSRGANHRWNSKGVGKHNVRRSQVLCGLGARARLEFGSLSTIAPIDSSSLESTNEDEDDELSELYAPISKENRSPPRLLKGLTMIEEISPILDPDDDFPKIPSLQLNRDWRPLQTSTTTSVHHVGQPKTNPRVIKATCSTPRRNGPNGGPILSYNNALLDGLERPMSFFDETPSKEWSAPKFISSTSASTWKPDHFGLPAPFARKIGCKGKLHLTMSISGRFLTVSITRGYFFLDPCQSHASSYVRVEIKRNPRYHKRRRSSSEDRSSLRSEYHEQNFRTRLVPLNNRPQFFENFTFELHRRHYHNHDMLGVSVWATNADNTS